MSDQYWREKRRADELEKENERLKQENLNLRQLLDHYRMKEKDPVDWTANTR